MAGTWTYDHTTNIITVIGGTSGAPCAFIDAWNADKAGTQELVHTRTITAADGAAVNCSHNLRPTDYYVLGGAALDLYIVVSGWANMTAATIQLTGTDSAGNAQTEDIPITGDGTYYATKYFKTLTKTQVTVFTKTDGGTFAYVLTQGQWGRVWKTNLVQFMFDSKLYIGDGSTDTWFVDTLKEIIFSDGIVGGSWEFLLYSRANTHVTFGILENATLKTSSSGCIFRSLEDSQNANLFIYINTGALYSCTFAAVDNTPYHFVTVLNDGPVWNCSCIKSVLFWGCRADFYNVYVTKSTLAFSDINVNSKMNLLFVTECNAALYAYAATATTISNTILRRNTYMMSVISATVDSNLINIDTDAWTFTYSGTCTGKIYRKNTIDIKVTDKDNNNISGATVALVDKDGNSIFSVTTAANGTITQQTVSRGYYAQATGDTLQEYSPHTLTITMAGYQKYVKKFTLTDKTSWEIKLAKISQILLDQGGKPILNVVPTDPENKIVVKL